MWNVEVVVVEGVAVCMCNNRSLFIVVTVYHESTFMSNNNDARSVRRRKVLCIYIMCMCVVCFYYSHYPYFYDMGVSAK